MTDRPILFSAPMVRALLDGRKTQTRRIIKGAPGDGWTFYSSVKGHKWIGPNGYPSTPYVPRFAVGDRLWVRETWRTARAHDGDKPAELTVDMPAAFIPISYEADRGPEPVLGDMDGKTRVAIHMPRWASRLTLNVTDVRVERLHAITADDARAEGVEHWYDARHREEHGHGYAGIFDGAAALGQFVKLWESVNGPDAWHANPWVVALTFEVDEWNIDHAG